MASNDIVYAVRHGRRNPAIYDKWDECQAATRGFSKPMWREMRRHQAETCLNFLGE
jgi:viroplasmin and RNaseH domain-containing protein